MATSRAEFFEIRPGLRTNSPAISLEGWLFRSDPPNLIRWSGSDGDDGDDKGMASMPLNNCRPYVAGAVGEIWRKTARGVLISNGFQRVKACAGGWLENAGRISTIRCRNGGNSLPNAPLGVFHQRPCVATSPYPPSHHHPFRMVDARQAGQEKNKQNELLLYQWQQAH